MVGEGEPALGLALGRVGELVLVGGRIEDDLAGYACIFELGVEFAESAFGVVPAAGFVDADVEV